MSTSEKAVNAIHKMANARALCPHGWNPTIHFSRDLCFKRASFAKVSTLPKVLARKKATTAVRQKNLPIRTAEIVDMVTDSGRLQKTLSTRERVRKPCMLDTHPNR